MTPEQLEKIGWRLFGHRWQTPMSWALGVADRTVRRLVSGKTPISESLSDAILRLDAHDRWVVGDGVETRREYITHTKWPRFTGRLATDAEVIDFDGLTYGCWDGTTLCEIVWVDAPPATKADLLGLFTSLDSALEAVSLDDAETGHLSPS